MPWSPRERAWRIAISLVESALETASLSLDAKLRSPKSNTTGFWNSGIGGLAVFNASRSVFQSDSRSNIVNVMRESSEGTDRGWISLDKKGTSSLMNFANPRQSSMSQEEILSRGMLIVTPELEYGFFKVSFRKCRYTNSAPEIHVERQFGDQQAYTVTCQLSSPLSGRFLRIKFCIPVLAFGFLGTELYSKYSGMCRVQWHDPNYLRHFQSRVNSSYFLQYSKSLTKNGPQWFQMFSLVARRISAEKVMR